MKKLWFLVLLLASCSRERLTVYTEDVVVENLASYIVQTPDPRKFYPFYGQQLMVSWNLDRSAHWEASHVLLRIQFACGEDELVDIPCGRRKGYYIYRLMNQDYDERGAILSFVADLYEGECFIEEWRHPLFEERIELEEEEEE